jgi:hypothetical protein
MIIMRKLILVVLATLAFSFTSIKNTANEDFCSTLQKMLRQADSKFKNIKGDTISSSEGTVGYSSKLTLPGSIGTTIFIQGDQAYLSSVMYTSNDIKEIKSRYQSILEQLKKCSFLKDPEKEDIGDMDESDLNTYTFEEKVSKYAHSVELTISPSCSSGYCIILMVWFR